MAHPLQPADLFDRAKEIALAKIAPRREELISREGFPEDLWQSFADAGLTAASVGREHGGADANFATLAKLAAVLNRHGRVPGVTMTLLGHLLVARLHVMADAPVALQQDLLPRIAAGEAIVCVAISEPGAGAHPKHLKTTALRDGNDFLISGEKAFLTKGPMASHFLVLAITSEEAGRKAFSAILVPAATPGLRKTPGIKIDFLHPCPHGGIEMDACRVPTSNLFGEEGTAFERTSLRMRAIEDAIGAGPQVANLQALLADLVETDLLQDLEMAETATRLTALSFAAEQLATRTDDEIVDIQALLRAQLGFRQLIRATAHDMQGLVDTHLSDLSPASKLLARDIAKSQSIAQSAHESRLVKVGQEIKKDPDLI